MAIRGVLDFLEKHKDGRLALICHQRPDGDAIGSCLGLAGALRGLGRKADVLNALPLPGKLLFLDPSGINIKREDPDWHRDFAAVVVLDCGEIDRLDPLNRTAASSLPACTIDHHISSRGVGEAVWIEPGASSAGEMVVTLCQAAGWSLPPASAQALWTAIVTDTGRFSFENTIPSTLAAAGHCVASGAEPAVVTQHIYQSVSPAERVLQARTLTRMRLLENGRLAVSWLSQEDFREAGLGPEVDLDVVNLLRDTAGVEVAVFLYETAPLAGGAGQVKASLRTASPHNAVIVAKQFAGGGHMRAAGCSLKAPLPEVEEKLLAAVKTAFFTNTPG